MSVRFIGVLGLCAGLYGCRQTDFSPDTAAGLVHTKPIHLDAEQAVLTAQQINCGVEEELWQPAVTVGEHTTCHLLSKGRDLNFDDDVMLNEPGFSKPYIQLRGDFTASLGDGAEVREPEKNVKMVNGKLLISIPHMCFADPIPLMGVRKGKFSEDAPPVMRFELLDDGWHYDKLVH